MVIGFSGEGKGGKVKGKGNSNNGINSSKCSGIRLSLHACLRGSRNISTLISKHVELEVEVKV